MRVLEVGPGDFPIEKYFGDPFVEFTGVDMGVWDSNNNGFSDETFWAACDRFRKTRDGVGFFYEPLSSIAAEGFDIAIACNVFGDPRAIPKESTGLIKHPGEEDAILAKALRSKLNDDGVLRVLETYTPIYRQVLVDLLGAHGFEVCSLLEGSDVEGLLYEWYPANGKKMVDRISPMNRLLTALAHGLEGAVDSPYAAEFRPV